MIRDRWQDILSDIIHCLKMVEERVKPRKQSNVKVVTGICKKLSSHELQYLLSVCDTNFSNLVCELLHNTCLNDAIFKKLEGLKKFKTLCDSLKADKANILRVLNTRSPQRRRHLLKRQAGSGIISGIASFLAIALPAIIAGAKSSK